jgi:tetraacyldisaccharide 4'-kinase
LLATEARRVDESLTRPLDDFSEQTVHAVAGIGNPERFFRMLESFGMHVVRHPLPDHAKISRNDLQFDDAFDVVITEKDAVKCQALDAGHCWYVPADVSIDESDRVALLEKLLHKIENRVAS